MWCSVNGWGNCAMSRNVWIFKCATDGLEVDSIFENERLKNLTVVCYICLKLYIYIYEYVLIDIYYRCANLPFYFVYVKYYMTMYPLIFLCLFKTVWMFLFYVQLKHFLNFLNIFFVIDNPPRKLLSIRFDLELFNI